MLGEGLYTELRYDGIHRILGRKKLIFRILSENFDIFSDGSEKYALSFITRSGFHEGGEHDYTDWDEKILLPDYDDTNLENVSLTEPLIDAEYCYTDCPPDRIIRALPAKLIYSNDRYKIYDCGEGTTGYPIVISKKGFEGEIRITFSERLCENGDDIDPTHSFMQHLYATVSGKETEIYPYFSWFGFRYFRIEGEAICNEVKVVHMPIEVSSSFKTNDQTLNWIYDAYINTQLTNLHRGGPSDCPHLEREFYTGDGQLMSKTVMMTLAARELYKKWIIDISDCQDKISGRVQYTAPYFISCGGGPGGWSSAIVAVPYEYYKAYGDDTYIKLLYPQMIKYLDFLEEHSEADLVTSFKDGDWCLGDWAGPVKWMLPAPFVNTYFRVLSTMRVIEIAREIGETKDIPRLENDLKKCRAAIDKFYLNSFNSDSTYCANVQGAGAFALSIGLGTEITKRKLIEYYEKNPYYDTGIFATELLTRALFELGRADLAYKLLTADNPHGYGKWRSLGSNTLHEYFTSPSRSHSHPMFGSVVGCMIEYILGIRQTDDSVGYRKVTISPKRIKELTEAVGHITCPHGKISVSYTTNGNSRFYRIEIPIGVSAIIDIEGSPFSSVGGGIYEFKTAY